MTCHHPLTLAIVISTVSNGWLAFPARAQVAPPQGVATASVDSGAAARRKVLESDRWQRANRAFNGWLSVQQIYSPQEVARMRAELRARIAAMSASELEEFLKVMEQRLEALLSPEAEEARRWLAQFLATARHPERQLGRELPDVMNMTAGQIRQELHDFQQQRAARQQAQAAFDRSRARQVQSAQEAQTARGQALQQAREGGSRAAANVQFRSQYAPRPGVSDLQPAPFFSPYYRVAPWGAPVRWNPLRETYWW